MSPASCLTGRSKNKQSTAMSQNNTVQNVYSALPPFYLRKSEGFQSLPWISSIYDNVGDLALRIENVDSIKKIVQKIDAEEREGVVHPRNAQLTQFLAGKDDGKRDEESIRLLLTYRVIDIASWIHQGGDGARISTDDAAGSSEVISHYPKLADWRGILVTCLEDMQLLWDRGGRIATMDLSSLPAHYASMCAGARDTNALATISNFIKAAFHLRYLLGGQLDLPNSAEVLENELKAMLKLKNMPHTAADRIDSAAWFGKKTNKLSELRAPLYLCLTTTPICLLLSTQIHVRVPGLKKLVQAWKDFGYHKPASILEAEKLIWRLLWEICQGNTENFIERLIELLKALLHIAEQAERRALQWFKPLTVPTMPTLNYRGQRHPTSSCQSPPSPLSQCRSPASDLRSAKSQSQLSSRRRRPSLSREKVQSALPPQSHDVLSDKSMTATGNESSRLLTHHEPPRHPSPCITLSNSRNPSPQPVAAAGPLEGNNEGAQQDDIQIGEDEDALRMRYWKNSYNKRPRSTTLIPVSSKRQATRELRNKPKPQPPVGIVIVEPPVMYRERINIAKEYKDPTIGVEVLDLIHNVHKFHGHCVAEFPILGSNEIHRYHPQFHFKEDLGLFYEMYSSIDRTGKPYAHVMTYQEYTTASHRSILDIFRRQHILVVDGPKPGYGFDKFGLRQLAPLGRDIMIQDQSVKSDENPDAGLMVGTLRDFLKIAEEQSRKALNGLDFPMPFENLFEQPVATDVHAWKATQNLNFCGSDYPYSKVRWGLCATTDAFHKVHIDCDGFGTFIAPESGVKIWLVAVPIHDNDFASFGKTNIFLGKFNLESPNNHLWRWQVIIQEPGNIFIMRPNTPHVVYTARNSVCKGGHFYSTPTLRDTCYGMFHTFAVGNLITNTEHTHDAFIMLTRIMAFFHQHLYFISEDHDDMQVDEDNLTGHLPDLKTFDGILDLMSLCSLMELSNVLNDWSYLSPGEGVTERQRLIYARLRGRQMLAWFFSNYQLLDKDDQTVDGVLQLYWPYVAQQARALVSYKRAASKVGGGQRVRNEACSPKAVQSVVERSLKGYPRLYALYKEGPATDTFAWVGEHYQVRAADGSNKVPTVIEAMDGLTMDDTYVFSILKSDGLAET